jgi:hypothetical protein
MHHFGCSTAFFFPFTGFTQLLPRLFIHFAPFYFLLVPPSSQALTMAASLHVRVLQIPSAKRAKMHARQARESKIIISFRERNREEIFGSWGLTALKNSKIIFIIFMSFKKTLN